MRRKEQLLLVERWNSAHKVGTPVRYWKGARTGPGVEGKTRTLACLLDSGTAVVWVTGAVGCIALTHVEAL